MLEARFGAATGASSTLTDWHKPCGGVNLRKGGGRFFESSGVVVAICCCCWRGWLGVCLSGGGPNCSRLTGPRLHRASTRSHCRARSMGRSAHIRVLLWRLGRGAGATSRGRSPLGRWILLRRLARASFPMDPWSSTLSIDKDFRAGTQPGCQRGSGTVWTPRIPQVEWKRYARGSEHVIEEHSSRCPEFTLPAHYKPLPWQHSDPHWRFRVT